MAGRLPRRIEAADSGGPRVAFGFPTVECDRVYLRGLPDLGRDVTGIGKLGNGNIYVQLTKRSNFLMSSV